MDLNMQTYTKSSTLYVWRNNCAINRSLNWEQNKVYSSPNSLSCKVDINAIFALKANSLSNALWPLDILGIVKLFISCIFKHNNLLNYYKCFPIVFGLYTFLRLFLRCEESSGKFLWTKLFVRKMFTFHL